MAEQKTEFEIYAELVHLSQKIAACIIGMDEGPDPEAEATMVKLLRDGFALDQEIAQRFNVVLPDQHGNLPELKPGQRSFKIWQDEMERRQLD